MRSPSAVTLGFAGIAAAHANLASSDPAANALLDHAPANVTMTFTEPPDPKLSIVHVLDVNGTDVESGTVQAVPANNEQLMIPLPADLPDGVYTVSWRVVSEADGHATAGAFSFGVNVAPDTVIAPSIPAPAAPSPSVASVASKVALYIGLAMLFSASTVGLLAFGGNVPSRRPVLLIGAGAASIGAVGMLLSERAALDVSMSDLLSSSTGRDFLWLLGGVTFAAVASIDAARRPDRTSLVAGRGRRVGGDAHPCHRGPRLRRRDPRARDRPAVVPLHGGERLDGRPLARVPGCSRDVGRTLRSREVRRYSSLAGYAVVVVLVTGVLRATEEVGGLSNLLHLFSTSYLTALDIKVAVVLLLIGLGAVNRYRSIPRMSASTGLLRRVMAIELVGALGVFGLTGTLTGLSPRPPVTPPAPKPQHVTLTGSDFATTMNVTLVVTPGTAGPNGFDAEVTDFDSGAPFDATDVSLRFEPVGQPGVGASTLELAHHGDHWMANGSQVSIAGVWTITVVVQTASSGDRDPADVRDPDPGPERHGRDRRRATRHLYGRRSPTASRSRCTTIREPPGRTSSISRRSTPTGTSCRSRARRWSRWPPTARRRRCSRDGSRPGHFVGDLTLTPGRGRSSSRRRPAMDASSWHPSRRRSEQECG